jgi:hypothetical protein
MSLFFSPKKVKNKDRILIVAFLVNMKNATFTPKSWFIVVTKEKE